MENEDEHCCQRYKIEKNKINDFAMHVLRLFD